MKRVRFAYAGGIGLVVGLSIAALACTGCHSRELVINGTSGIISHEAQAQLGRLAIGAATEQDVLAMFGKPIGTFPTEDGGKKLGYNCVATVMNRHYLFNPKVQVLESQDTRIYTCSVYVGPEGKVRDVDYRFGTSNQNLHPVLLPRSE